jgi:hypothetical protein
MKIEASLDHLIQLSLFANHDRKGLSLVTLF